VKTLWRGLQCLKDMEAGWLLSREPGKHDRDMKQD
jgi:hypothetical protein